MAEYIAKVAADFWATVVEMSPYLLFGFFMAGLLSILVSQRLVERHLGGSGIWPLVKASVFGVPLPLCSCGVIPVSMSLHKHGASKGSSVAFLLSTPQTGVDSIFVTFSLLGTAFAIYRPIAALVTGIVGGLLVNTFGDANGDTKPAEKCTDQCCKVNAKFKNRAIGGFRFAFITLPTDIGRSMLIGLAIAALISAFVPEGFFAEKLGSGIGAMLLMMIVGIPLYVCATASVPIAAALIFKGLSPGAALVFLMTGPATNAASFVTIWNTLGKRTAIIYLLTVAGCALAAGLTLDFIGTKTPIGIITHGPHLLPHWLKIASALLLLGLLAFGIVRSIIRKKH